MKLLSRLFRKPPAPTPAPAPPSPEPATPAAASPPPPQVDPDEHARLLRDIEGGGLPVTERMRLAACGPTTRIRQAAAATITDPALWPELLQRLRGRDKAAYKLIRQRSDALLDAQRRAEHVASEAASLCASLERHASRPVDSAYATMLAVLESRWQGLPADGGAGADDADLRAVANAGPVVAADANSSASASAGASASVGVGAGAELRHRGEQALARCREALAAQRRELERLAAERAAAEELARSREAERRAQQEIAEQQAAEAARVRAAADLARDSDAAAEAQAAADRRKAESQMQAEIASLIRLASAALQRGDSRKAARFRQSIEEHLATAPALPPPLVRSLEQLDAKLNELRQWKDYVAAPKRLELIEEMEALVGVDEPPEPLAEHIRALRQEWRTLNKGLVTLPEADAERFEQAYQAAFKPCQAHFAAQAAQRRAHLEARQRVLERLLAFEAGLDAEAPDYPLIGRVLREAPQEWRSHSPVDRDVARPLEVEFHRGLDRLRARLDAWQARNAADKQTLVTKARQLAQVPDIARAIDEAKRLQAEWKATGPAPHAQSQALWEEFRALCNDVFERRQQAVAAQSAALGQARAQVEALCAQIEQASGEAPADRSAGEARLLEWREAFDAVGELPRAEARGLQQRFQRATARFEAQLAELEQRDAETAESRLLAAIRQLRAYQRSVLEGAAAAERDARRSSAEDSICGLQRSPGKGVLQALRQGLARADALDFAAANADDAGRERELRRLCVRAEIFGGGATPAADAALRREQELQLLRQGLGQARRLDDPDRDAMRLEWLDVVAVEPALHDELEQRFLRSLGRRR
ncbi:MAG: DUF349 domain-containing protein [Gammaproteobacteria bacterium]|nr:DUF349 domain-containing protein [Gammaproteobacteria bacterium]